MTPLAYAGIGSRQTPPDVLENKTVLAVVCWSDRGRAIGGTGMGLRIGALRDIPVLNFGSMPHRAIWEALENVRARHLHRAPPGRPARARIEHLDTSFIAPGRRRRDRPALPGRCGAASRPESSGSF